MEKLMTNKTIFVATSNLHKIEELKKLIPSFFSLKIISNIDSLPHPIENGVTFLENAKKKGEHYSKLIRNEYVLCEDSGLECLALNGFPGVISKRWMENNSYSEKIEKLLFEIGSKSTLCRYVCSIVIYKNGELIDYSEGYCVGKLVKPTTNIGFAYDIGFVPDGYNKTFSNLPSNVKDSISHRKNAIGQLNFLKI